MPSGPRSAQKFHGKRIGLHDPHYSLAASTGWICKVLSIHRKIRKIRKIGLVLSAAVATILVRLTKFQLLDVLDDILLMTE
jgi:hypothetical protein